MKKILLIIGGIILVLLLGSMLLPSKVHVERKLVINAPAAKIFPQVNSLKNWRNWDPWSKRDPNMVNEYSGPEAGVGNKNVWKSEHKQVGNGAQWITESVENEKIVSQLDFGQGEPPTGTFTFAPEGEGTKVVWSIDMDMGMSPMGKIFGLMMDGMIGPDFEQGLKNLKELVESLPDEVPLSSEESAVSDSLSIAAPSETEKGN